MKYDRTKFSRTFVLCIIIVYYQYIIINLFKLNNVILT